MREGRVMSMAALSVDRPVARSSLHEEPVRPKTCPRSPAQGLSVSHLDNFLDSAIREIILSRMDNLDSIFHCLSDGTRRAVIAKLVDGPAPVSSLAVDHDMALPSFLKHINILERSGWIETEKSGRVRTCRLRPETVKAAEGWLEGQRKLWEARFDRLDAFLGQINENEDKT